VSITAEAQPGDTIRVTWEATDPSTGSGQAPSGIASCVLDVQAPDGAWTSLSSESSGTYDYTPDTPGHLYVFRVTAADTAGNEASAEDGAGLPRTTKYYYHPSTGSGQAGGARVAMRVDEPGGAAVYYLHADHLV